MSKKPKFNPEIRQIKLSPEQAVLACDCFSIGNADIAASYCTTGPSACIGPVSYARTLDKSRSGVASGSLS